MEFHNPGRKTADRPGRAKDGAGSRPDRLVSPSVKPPQFAVPAVVADVLRTAGRPLDAFVRRDMEPRFGQDFSHVRVHSDAAAADAAGAIRARAFTTGRHLVFGAAQYQPQTPQGRRLLSHELAHVVQQHEVRTDGGTPLSLTDRGDAEAESAAETTTVGLSSRPGRVSRLRFAGRVVQRTPDRSSGAAVVADRDKVRIEAPTEVVATVSGGSVILRPGPVTVTAKISEREVRQISWELHDPAGKLLSRKDGHIGVLAHNLFSRQVFDGGDFGPDLTEGRHTLRCVGRKEGKVMAFSDRSFFLWTRTPLSMQSLGSLQKVSTDPSRSLGDVAAAKARSLMLEHREAVARSGTGTVMGNQTKGALPPGVTREDCTTYVVKVLQHAFAVKGRTADWAKVFREAQRASGPALKGTALMAALESVAGWKGIFWSPDPRNPEDRSSEHPAAFKAAKGKGEYYGVTVAAHKSVVDFRRTSGTAPQSMSRLDQLRKVPLGVIAARGGLHMTLLLNGNVYEVHWDRLATDPDVIEATPLETWEWQSGAVVMPQESFDAAFGP